MAVGEDQIVAQVKAAARAAAAAGTTGPALTGLIDAALRASKRARTQTAISTEGISLARAGLDLAAGHVGGLAARNAVVLGTGSMGKLAARLLRQAGVGRLGVASRSLARAAAAAAAVRGGPLAASDVPAALADTDILVTATGSAVPVMRAGQVRAARAGGLPLFVLDLGMPANVEPAVGRLAGVTLVDLATLGRPGRPGRTRPDPPGPCHRRRRSRRIHGPAGRGRRGAGYRRDARAYQQLADAELARLQDRLPGLSEQQRAETAATVHRILRKILHRPTVRAKEFSAAGRAPLPRRAAAALRPQSR